MSLKTSTISVFTAIALSAQPTVTHSIIGAEQETQAAPAIPNHIQEQIAEYARYYVIHQQGVQSGLAKESEFTRLYDGRAQIQRTERDGFENEFAVTTIITVLDDGRLNVEIEKRYQESDGSEMNDVVDREEKYFAATARLFRSNNSREVTNTGSVITRHERFYQYDEEGERVSLDGNDFFVYTNGSESRYQTNMYEKGRFVFSIEDTNASINNGGRSNERKTSIARADGIHVTIEEDGIEYNYATKRLETKKIEAEYTHKDNLMLDFSQKTFRDGKLTWEKRGLLEEKGQYRVNDIRIADDGTREEYVAYAANHESHYQSGQLQVFTKGGNLVAMKVLDPKTQDWVKPDDFKPEGMKF